MTIIECENRQKIYHQGTQEITALDGISLAIGKGGVSRTRRTLGIWQDHPAQYHRRTGPLRRGPGCAGRDRLERHERLRLADLRLAARWASSFRPLT